MVGVPEDPAADLEQGESEGLHAHQGDASFEEPAADRVEQPVAGGREEQAELVRPEAMVGESVGEAGGFQLVDPLFGLSPIDVPVVELKRRVLARRDDEPDVRALGERLSLEDDSAGMLPGACLVEGVVG